MHYLLKQEGMGGSNELDLGIGISFCDIPKMNQEQMSLGHFQLDDDDLLER